MIVGSPVDYEELTAEIVIDGEFIALVQNEEGNDRMIIEFYEKKIKPKVYLNDFIAALQDAKALLME